MTATTDRHRLATRDNVDVIDYAVSFDGLPASITCGPWTRSDWVSSTRTAHQDQPFPERLTSAFPTKRKYGMWND